MNIANKSYCPFEESGNNSKYNKAVKPEEEDKAVFDSIKTAITRMYDCINAFEKYHEDMSAKHLLEDYAAFAEIYYTGYEDGMVTGKELADEEFEDILSELKDEGFLGLDIEDL